MYTALAITGTIPQSITAKVTSQSDSGFVSEHQLILDKPPAEAYRALTDDVSLWWNPAHTYSGNSSNLSLNARALGCFCEKLVNGGSVAHMQVVHAAPGKSLVMTGGLGPLQSMGVSGAMTFTFAPFADQRTQLTYRYTVAGYQSDLADLAGPVDEVQLGQLQRLQKHLARR